MDIADPGAPADRGGGGSPVWWSLVLTACLLCLAITVAGSLLVAM